MKLPSSRRELPLGTPSAAPRGDRALTRRAVAVALAVVLGTFVAATVAIAAIDRSTRDAIAPGVRVAGIDVGGLTADAAAARLRARLADYRPRLELVGPHLVERIDVHRRLRWRPDVGAMVDEALARSRAGGPVGRALRRLTGERLEVDLPLRSVWSHQALRQLVGAVAQRVDVPPRDAQLLLPSMQRVAERRGVRVERERLAARIERALASGSRGAVRVPVRSERPRVTLADLPARWPLLIVVDRSSFTLRLYDHLRLVRSYPVAIGAVGYETPAGLYRIQSKAVNPVWHVPNRPWAGKLAGKVIPPGPDNPIKARWLGFYDGAGIHGTDAVGSIGSRASHGCVRMRIPDVIDLYERVPVGTPIYIGG